ncbi:4-amino-4-deoxychorismate lyase [Bacillus coahuilensis m2-6]|uniref:aminodeoxychorismate lyase n=1 Tax=Bacillus coahuilensis TaxID=408580 RepID=UPI0007506951|nr:aminodeoxychorismate lyase [Bacillus coahuilensis]KUP04202.1 4-amino-4-deoxychorismate lyase [Bacillus coahuilensis m2-6]
MYLYLNGDYIKGEEARISPFDHGFLYGVGVFETFRTYGGHPFLLDDHIDRLNRSLRELQIERSFTREEVGEIVQRLLEKNELQDAYIRFNVSGGVGEIGLQTSAYREPTVICFQKELPVHMSKEKRAKVLTLPRNTPETRYRLKSHHYMNNIEGKREIKDTPEVEGLFLTAEGFVAEGITSNIFLVKNGRLLTPVLDTGILNGVTREFVMELGKSMGLEVETVWVRSEDLEKCEELFVTNSVQGIVAINECNGLERPGLSGKVTTSLMEQYEHYTQRTWSRFEVRGE